MTKEQYFCKCLWHVDCKHTTTSWLLFKTEMWDFWKWRKYSNSCSALMPRVGGWGVPLFGQKINQPTPPSDTPPLFWTRACPPSICDLFPKFEEKNILIEFYFNFDNIPRYSIRLHWAIVSNGRIGHSWQAMVQPMFGWHWNHTRILGHVTHLGKSVGKGVSGRITNLTPHFHVSITFKSDKTRKYE